MGQQTSKDNTDISSEPLDTSRELIAQMVRKARGDRSKSEFAKLLGVTHTSIHNWENRINYPDTKSFLVLGKMLGYGVEELLAILHGSHNKPVVQLPELISKVKTIKDKRSLFQISEALNQAWLNAV